VVKRKRKPEPEIEVTVQPPETPDRERTAKSLRGLRALAEQILAREAREREKKHDAA
jgi:hypothetical protein